MNDVKKWFQSTSNKFENISNKLLRLRWKTKIINLVKIIKFLITRTDNPIKNTYGFINKTNKINILLECTTILLNIKNNLNTSITKFKALKKLKNKLTFNCNFDNRKRNEIIRSINAL